jgi:ankyrin repeat protein
MNPELEKVLSKIRNAQLLEFDGVDAKVKDPNESGLFGTTPLHSVAIWGDVESARILLDAGAEIDVPAEEDCTALHEAINQGHLEMVKLLVSRGADLKRRCSFGNALELANLGESEEIKKFVRESAK